MTAKTVKMFGVEPVMAMVSFSTLVFHRSKCTVREAVAYLHKNHPEMVIDGEVQADFALNPEMLKEKFPFSKLAGKKSQYFDFSES
jgi:malate dehydrogenase (oxaloacetate-decarboxylating)(NADP+)